LPVNNAKHCQAVTANHFLLLVWQV